MRAVLAGRLVRLACEEGSASTESIASVEEVASRTVRRWLLAEPGPPERALLVASSLMTTDERAHLVGSFAEAIGADVVVLPGRAAGALGRTVVALDELRAALPTRRAA